MRFYGCVNFSSGGCGFFLWYDEVVCERGNEVIIWLNQKNNDLREENGWLRTELLQLHTQIENSKSRENELLLLRFIVVGVILVFLYWIIW